MNIVKYLLGSYFVLLRENFVKCGGAKIYGLRLGFSNSNLTSHTYNFCYFSRHRIGTNIKIISIFNGVCRLFSWTVCDPKLLCFRI